MILPSISSLTTLPDFTAALATLFEPVPVLAAALFDKKVASYDQLIDAAAGKLLPKY